MKGASATFALVRAVPDSYNCCVRTSTEEIDVDLARQQHGRYCKTLERLGLRLIWAERDDELPDSCFVEDTAVILNEKAVICNMSVKSRAPETVGVSRVLENLKQVYYIRPPAHIDGGDVLKIGNRIFIGISARTNLEAIDQIRQIAKDADLEVIPVKVSNVLHLKSACTYLEDEYVMLSKGNFNADVLSGLKRIVVAKGEEYAADCLVVNGTVLIAENHPKTRRKIESEGFQVEELEMSEFRKGDGALTCLSIIW